MLLRTRPTARPAVLLVSLIGALCLGSPGAAAAPSPQRLGPSLTGPRVVLAFLPLAEVLPQLPAQTDLELAAEPPLAFVPILDRLDARPQLSIGLSSATQGQYDRTQALLDISQGTRVSLSAYHPKRPAELAFVQTGAGSLFQGWLDDGARADGAPADLRPGLLGSLVPGGTAYAGVTGRDQLEAVAAADRAGRIGAVSIGAASDIAARAQALVAHRRFVVVGLPTGFAGDAAVDQLIRTRRPRELLLVMQTPPNLRSPQLLPLGVLGLGGGPGALATDTTHLGGIVAGIDILPTVLAHLHRAVPSVVKGQPMRVEPGRDAAGLRSLADRLRVVLPRRLPALWGALAVWLALLLAGALVADRRGVRWAQRVGALAILWIPSVVLLTAILRPSRGLEIALVSAFAYALAVATERWTPWPRGPAVPATVAIVAFSADLAFGSPLIIRSLLGPNPLFGSRFYGLGNELEATLPALMLVGLAAAMTGAGRSRRAVWTVVGAGLGLGLVAGAGRLGADVGGVITIGAGVAVMAIMLLPGGVTRRALAAAVVAPVLGLLLLAAVDLLTGGNSHFTRTVLRANGSGALWDVVLRRYELAWRQLRRGFTPEAVVIALLAIAVAVKHRGRILASVGGDPAWLAAFGGIAAIGVAGTLFNDSGPILLLFAVFIGACSVAYLRGAPQADAATGQEPC